VLSQTRTAPFVHSAAPVVHSSVQLHWPALHVPLEQVPQSAVRSVPQLSPALNASHSWPYRAHKLASVSGVHVPMPQVFGASTPQVSPVAQSPHDTMPPQPSGMSPQALSHAAGVQLGSVA
jgi:hypothetical protein